MPLRQIFPDPAAVHAAKIDTAKVDIIAVHGLNPKSKDSSEHAWDTWRTPSGPNGHLWLSDDLPSSVPESRIFLYEYDATAAFGRDTGAFLDEANELLEAIRTEREDDDPRPILLLGHSMGGLLIKQALINAHNDVMYTPIKNALAGLAFFATPHHRSTSNAVLMGGVAAQIALACGFKKGSNVVKRLKKGGLFSHTMREAWGHRVLDCKIISFWGADDLIVPKQNSRLNLPSDCENVVELDADHSGVCKFGQSQKDQNNLKLVRKNIVDLYKIALKKC